MKAIDRHRQTWQGKSDEWLFERIDNELKKVEEVHNLLLENLQLSSKTANELTLSDKQLRKMAKQACNGHQHAMRYGNMLSACFKMGKMILEELGRQKPDSRSINEQNNTN